MRRLFAIVPLLLTSLFFLVASDRAVAQYGSPDRLFTETSYDFKGIPRYTTPRHSFVFVNNSKEDLRIVAVRTSCQCTQAFIPEKRVFKTGEKGEVAAQIDAIRFTGARHATVTVTFERGGVTFEVPLNVVGTVLENVRVEPSKMNFVVDEIVNAKAETSDASTLSNRSQRATVFYPGNETVVRAECANPSVNVQIGQAVRSGYGTQTTITVSIRENASAGYLNEVVRLWSNGAYSQTPLSLNVSGSVRAQLSVSPSTLTFFTTNGEKLTKNIVVSATNEFTLKRVVSDSKAIECNIAQRALRPAKICVIPISFDPSKLQNESGMTRIKIETTDGRALYLPAQISSGNFEALGKTQTDKNAVVAEFDENEENLTWVSSAPKVISTDDQPIATANVGPANNQTAATRQQNNAYPRNVPNRAYQKSQPRAPFSSPFSPFGLFQ
ncbi:MAG: DUF1573 domain-containing protein [Thermoguttaceae bacterium]|nr:DUF1573 domain-containing protein [Thermoguttaceae bacterium]